MGPTPEPITKHGRNPKPRRPGPTHSYEIRVCADCSHESMPRRVRPRPFGEVPCAGCGGYEFTVYALELLQNRRSSTLRPTEA